MLIFFTVLTAMPVTLLAISKLGLASPPQTPTVIQAASISKTRSSREDVPLAA